MSWTLHNFPFDCINLRVHCESLSIFDVNQQNSEVCSAKVQGKELSYFLPCWKMPHVRWKTFDGGLFVSLFIQALKIILSMGKVYFLICTIYLFNGHSHPLLHTVDVVIINDQVSTQVLDPPPVIRY